MGLLSRLFGGKDPGKTGGGAAAETPPAGVKFQSGRAPAPAGTPSGPPTPKPKPAASSQATCATCGRPLLPRIPCPFCNPQPHAPVATDQTMTADYRPLSRLSSMAGIIAARELAEVKGAKGFLFVFEGPNKGTTVLFGLHPVIIGRAGGPPCDLALNDPGVSARHCEIRPEVGGFLLCDLGSKNGTFLSDQLVYEHALAEGEIIGFGTATRIYVGLL